MTPDAASARAAAYRVRFPRDEAREPWLPLLLDAYAVLDAGVAATVAASDRQAACRLGCALCCRQPIPASSLEILGLCWYVTHQCRDPMRRRLLPGLRDRRSVDCPFLVDGACAVYPLRPLVCREYVMLGPACRRDERPESTRPGDLLALPRAVQDRAFWRMLPYYGRSEPESRLRALRQRLVLRDSRLLRDWDWSWLAEHLTDRG